MEIGTGSFVFDASRLPKIDAHLMPFSIDYNGEALIKEYFQPVDKEGNFKSASFRGRELTGKTVQLSESCLGLKMNVDRFRTEWKATEQFDQITFWSPDDRLQPDQHIRESLPLWLRISRSVHDPIGADIE